MNENYNKDITDGLGYTINQAVERAIEKDAKESFEKLSIFVLRIIDLGISERSMKHFSEYLPILSNYYYFSYHINKKKDLFSPMHQTCLDKTIGCLKAVIDIISLEERKVSSISNLKQLNEFYYLAFLEFSRILYNMVSNQDVHGFKETIEYYKDISVKNNYDLEYDIHSLQKTSPAGSSNEQAVVLKEELYVRSRMESYKRHGLLGIRYWLIKLYLDKRIEKSIFFDLVSEISGNYYNSKDAVFDLLLFRNTYHYYFDWIRWDYRTRPEWRNLSPPNPNEWLTVGFLIDRISKNDFILIAEDFDEKEIEHLSHLYDSFQKYIPYFDKNYEYLKELTNVQTKDELLSKLNKILERFEAIKKIKISNKEKLIAEAALSPAKIADFRNTVGEKWKTQSVIHHIFKKFNNIEVIQNPEIMLRLVGQRNFYHKGKMVFIEGEYNETIYGMTDIGAQIGRWEDDEFFRIAMQDKNTFINGTSPLQIIRAALGVLSDKNVTPNSIILSRRSAYSDDSLFKSPLFTPKQIENENNNPLLISTVGYYNEIPIYISSSRFVENRILIGDFNSSFKMLIKNDPNWFDNELKVEVRLISEEEAEKILENDSAGRWVFDSEGKKMDRASSLTLIKNSVMADIWLTLKFNVENSGSYVLGQIVKGKKQYQTNTFEWLDVTPNSALPRRGVVSIIFSEANNQLVMNLPDVLHRYEVHQFFMYYFVENVKEFLLTHPFTGVSVIYADSKKEADEIVKWAVDVDEFDE